MSESPNERELTMCEFLQEEQDLEEDANAVLGGSDDTNCSYDKGYVPRQALYACKTCKITGEAGVCLACCYACHDGHEVVELYTKRNFRCDCGNGKFEGKTCTLKPDKDAENVRNRYNQNFKGLYCSCSRPYPDLEDDVQDVMIQCIMCEDWYHGRHLKAHLPSEYFEMVCYKCMESHKFLYSYLDTYNVKVDDSPKKKDTEAVSSTLVVKNENNTEVSSTSDLGNNPKACVKLDADDKDHSADSSVNLTSNSCSSANILPCIKPENVMNGIIKQETGSLHATKASEASCSVISNMNGVIKSACILEKLNANPAVMKGSAFWPENWRSELCACPTCTDMYGKNDCLFLLSLIDTIQAYEESGKGGSGESQYDQGTSALTQALNQLDRVKQMEAVRAYTSLKGELKEFLKEFAENKRTVCESDIKGFFERMSKKKKLNTGVPHFCR